MVFEILCGIIFFYDDNIQKTERDFFQLHLSIFDTSSQ